MRKIVMFNRVTADGYFVQPVFLGEGRTLISGASTLKLELLESKAYKSGNLTLRYAPL